ncbi:MAG: MarR family transcriptional regulator [Oscillospiraceae bacterium]|nr:MarR family transcriptional regulator [Oscillospiraceae bacterium]
MNEIKATVIEQLQHLQMFTNRVMGLGLCPAKKMPDPLKGQGRILKLLKMKPEMAQKELDYLADMRKPMLMETLEKLEQSGYITREDSVIRLTDAGAKAADEVNDNPVQISKVLDCMSEEELRTFSRYLARLITCFEEQFPGEDFEAPRMMMKKFSAPHTGK